MLLRSTDNAGWLCAFADCDQNLSKFSKPQPAPNVPQVGASDKAKRCENMGGETCFVLMDVCELGGKEPLFGQTGWLMGL